MANCEPNPIAILALLSLCCHLLSARVKSHSLSSSPLLVLHPASHHRPQQACVCLQCFVLPSTSHPIHAHRQRAVIVCTALRTLLCNLHTAVRAVHAFPDWPTSSSRQYASPQHDNVQVFLSSHSSSGLFEHSPSCQASCLPCQFKSFHSRSWGKGCQGTSVRWVHDARVHGRRATVRLLPASLNWGASLD